MGYKLTKEQETILQYQIKILTALQEGCFDKDSDNYISFSEMKENDTLNEFFHALANCVPTVIFNKVNSDEKKLNFLDFNHVANNLCFEFLNKE